MSDPLDRREANRALFARAVAEAVGGRDAVLACSTAEYKSLRAKALGAIAKLDSRMKMAANLQAIEHRFHNKGK